MGIASSAAGALGTVMGGFAKAKAARNVAGQLRGNAKTERALAGHRAHDKRRIAGLLESKALARAAAGGAGAADPTVVKIIGDIGAEGEYRALMDLFIGEEKAKGLEFQADVAEYEGDQEKAAAFSAAGANFSTGLARYGDDRKRTPQPVRMVSPPRTTKTIKMG